MSEPFVGQIMTVPYDYAPAQWGFCNGQQLPISQNQALFALLGIRFGGDGSTYFNLPDLQGRFVVGPGTAAGVAGAPVIHLADKSGQVQIPPQVGAHTHSATFTSAGGAPRATGNVTLPITASFSNVPVTVSGAMSACAAGASDDAPKAGYTLGDVNPGSLTRIYVTPSAGAAVALAPITSQGEVGGSVTGSAGGQVDLPVSNVGGGTVTVQPNAATTASMLPPYLALNSVIALMGIWPSRP